MATTRQNALPCGYGSEISTNHACPARHAAHLHSSQSWAEGEIGCPQAQCEGNIKATEGMTSIVVLSRIRMDCARSFCIQRGAKRTVAMGLSSITS